MIKLTVRLGYVTQFLDLAVIGVLAGTLYGLIALPLALMYKTVGFLDLAVGGYAVAAGIVAADMGWPAGALAGVGVAVALSAVTTLFFVLFQAVHRGAEPIGMSLATFGLLIAITAGIVLTFGTQSRFLPTLEGVWKFAGITVPRGHALALLVTLVLLGLVMLVLARTPVGLKMRASAVAVEHAELLGIPVLRMQCAAFLTAGLLAGIAGVLAISTVGLTHGSTVLLSLNGLAAAVLLGLRGPGTAFLGGIMLGVFESLSLGYIGPAVAGVLPSVLILVVLASGLSTRGTAVAARP